MTSSFLFSTAQPGHAWGREQPRGLVRVRDLSATPSRETIVPGIRDLLALHRHDHREPGATRSVSECGGPSQPDQYRSGGSGWRDAHFKEVASLKDVSTHPFGLIMRCGDHVYVVGAGQSGCHSRSSLVKPGSNERRSPGIDTLAYRRTTRVIIR